MKEETQMKKRIALFLVLLLSLPGFGLSESTGKEPVTVVLAENPTTGFQWSYTFSQEGILRETGSEYQTVEGDEGMVGGGGAHVWTFEPIAQGDVTVRFSYSQPWDTETPPARMVSYTYRVGENKQVNLVGDVDAEANDVSVTLRSNPTTGYEWSYTVSEEGILSEVSNEYESDDNPEGMVGVGGSHNWLFEAVGPGDVTLSFSYSQSWETDVEPADRLECTVHVDESNQVTLSYPDEPVQAAFALAPAVSSLATITLGQDKLYVAQGKTASIKYSIAPRAAKSKGVTFTSSDESIATVSSKGKVKGITAGECEILLTSKLDESATVVLPVSVVIPVKKVALTAAAKSVNVGQTLPTQVSFAPEEASVKEAVYKSSNNKIATVDENGVVTGIKAGKVTITATAVDGSKKNARLTLQVVQPPTGIHFARPDTRVGVNAYTTLSAILEPKNATKGAAVTWTSSDESVATVSGTSTRAKIRGHRWGRCTLTATTVEGGYTASIHVNVGSLRHALKITNLAIKDGKPYITIKNLSNLNITQVRFEMAGYDIQGNPIQLSTHDQILTGSYDYPLAPGASTNHGQFTFNKPTKYTGLAHLTLTITGWSTDTGYYNNNGELRYSYNLDEKNYEWVDAYSKLLM